MNDQTAAIASRPLCSCGCGQRTTLASSRFLPGHNMRLITPTTSPNPSGLCLCGCGQPAPIAKRSLAERGMVKGQPRPYIPGHLRAEREAQRRHERLQQYAVVDRGYETPCWEWTGRRAPSGHGRVYYLRNGSPRQAHRVSYEQAVGPIPEGLEVHHLCENPPCINPEHLVALTPTDHRLWDGRAKLTNEQVLLIRGSSESRHALAERFGVSKSIITRIRSGRYRPLLSGPGVEQAVVGEHGEVAGSNPAPGPRVPGSSAGEHSTSRPPAEPPSGLFDASVFVRSLGYGDSEAA